MPIAPTLFVERADYLRALEDNKADANANANANVNVNANANANANAEKSP